MTKELGKAYQPQEVETAVYQMWTEGGYFAPRKGSKPTYTIVIPPPNVTGQLHLGHAVVNTLQDTLIRYKRMDGYETLWMPGTDHAGIATQIVVEAELKKKENKTRFDLGREAFVERVWEWKETYGNRIVEQLKKLGASCDWDRLRFTMDEGLSRAVREVFVALYEKGLIYRGNRITNICICCQTALSETEVEYEEQDGKLYYVRYPVSRSVRGSQDVSRSVRASRAVAEEGSEFPLAATCEATEQLVVATTRPETMLGDMAVAVHPEDGRYKHLIGKTVTLPLMNREIPVIADEYVDKEFGTGCVKITPCHDPNDYDVAKRHKLPELLIMDQKGVINKNGGKYNGLTREKARIAVLEDLEKGGFLVKTEPHPHNVGTCARCHQNVEPMASEQWFVSMKSLAEPAIAAVKEGRTKFVPERFEKLYLHWIENVRDWCVSRQIWWGHRIPVWTCVDCARIVVSSEDPTECPLCKSGHLVQDPDVLDTWFSSALWPFSTLGWPDDTEDLRRFYPTDVLVTAYDIIYLWVARMIFSGIEQTGQEPFHTVYMHGLLRDAEGRKMSKSLGNGIDPLEMIDKYGADALRVYIITLVNLQGGDIRFVPERCEHFRNFCNKLWNASRFVLSSLGDTDCWTLPESLTLPDMWIVTKLQSLIYDITAHLDKYELNLAALKMTDFIWDDFCDWYIELAKIQLRSDDTKETTQQILAYVLETALRLLHPFAPFITEEIWQSFPGGLRDGPSLMIAKWPEPEDRLRFKRETAEMELLMDTVRAVRARRNEMKVPPSKKAAWTVETQHTELFERHADMFRALAGAGGVTFGPAPEGAVTVVSDGATVYLPLAELVDLEAERARLQKELAAAQKDYDALSQKLQNEHFISKAPERVVAAERERLTALKERIERLSQ
ncbi:MAG: valine--tRNA ligase [Oscillospiraceae bacterium]|jgi:valyl-tRNA synthetase|nr:valine--tRNA ligase [Oscillospiraceae bacterium]